MRIALPPMRRSRLLAAVLLALAPAVSATARDGREPEVRPATARPERVLSREEIAGNCAGLTVILKTRIDRLRELQKQAKKEQQGPPPSLMALFGARPAANTLAKERERVEALNVALSTKGCTMLNVDAELRRAPPAAAKARK